MPYMCVEVREQPVGVNSLLSPCGSLESTLVARLGGKCLNSLSHLTSLETFVWVGGDGAGDETQDLVCDQSMRSLQQHPSLCIWKQSLLLIPLWVYRIINCNWIWLNWHNEITIYLFGFLFSSIIYKPSLWTIVENFQSQNNKQAHTGMVSSQHKINSEFSQSTISLLLLTTP